MTALAVRRLVIAGCGVGITGMVVGSVTSNNGVALTFGLCTAGAVLCLIVATAVSNPVDRRPDASDNDVDAQADGVEELLGALVEAGADESRLRALVGEAVRLGRALQARDR